MAFIVTKLSILYIISEVKYFFYFTYKNRLTLKASLNYIKS